MPRPHPLHLGPMVAVCGLLLLGPLTKTKETTEKSIQPTQTASPGLPALTSSFLPPSSLSGREARHAGVCRTKPGGPRGDGGRRQAEVGGGYISGDQPHLSAEWAGDRWLFSQFSKKGPFCAMCLERVEP
ncbi:hypothetical protein mRhiFer1_008608 [Rhinolophus ferrumequinum]|uniref:Uncharacterized protein n=1 Tax=Rhinolophus ferrumequinum TaxID=59479 RepID=A0A7J7U0Z4_RHIFE|nr:hypothetical protein mRhiFer1_008608 [Rhinolophus ferrumequinum]